jgi:predicted deacylase
MPSFMNELNYYSRDYQEARTRFLQLSSAKGAALHALPVNEKEALFIDVAVWQGSNNTLILHSSGLHGVEAFAGSAVQCAFIDTLKKDHLQGKTLVLVHCANPYGMKYLRRWNAENIDLNRNFIDLLEELPQNPKYEKVSTVLNPKYAHQLKGFYRKAFSLLIKYGFPALQQAIAQGQYFYPEGVFYGGTSPTVETKRLLEFFKQHLTSYNKVIGIDFHTGLGKYKQSSFFLEGEFSTQEKKYVEKILKTSVIHVAQGKRKTYQTKGGLIARLKQLYPDKNFVMVSQEIGTAGPIKIIKALREENYYYQHHFSQRQPSAHRLKAVFCPEDDDWKATAVREGVRALSQLLTTTPIPHNA